MGKIGSTILTFLFSIPVTAVGWMAIFGVPPIASLSASPKDDVVIRDPFETDQWGNSFRTEQPRVKYEDAPQFTGSQFGDNQRIGNDSSVPISRPEQLGSHSFNNNPSINSTPSQPFPNARQVPNQPPSTNDNRHSFNTETNAPPAAHANTPANGMQNPFANESSSVRPGTETSAQMLSWQEASARLTELGIKKYHLERGGEEGMFLFVCLYQPSDSPQVTHRFEAEGDNPLVAVNQVLSQVDGWLQKQYQESHKYTGVSFTR